MRRVSNGFTIVEVMIFFTVSSLLMVSAWGLIAGRQEQVTFDQKMRDTQSKLQQWISDVSTGVTGGDPSQQYCDNNGPGHTPHIVDPHITPNPAKPSSYSPDCTFLGKAIQFTDSIGPHSSQDSTLYAYSVFGCSINSCGSGGNNDLPPDMNSANPEPAIGGSATVMGQPYTYSDLTETFDLSPAYVKIVCGVAHGGAIPTDVTNCPTPNATNSHMIGFMNSFNTLATTTTNGTGSEDLSVYLYNLNNNEFPAYPTGPSNARDCLEVNGACNNPPYLLSYQFCLKDGNHSAQITITSASGIGATTKLDYIAC